MHRAPRYFGTKRHVHPQQNATGMGLCVQTVFPVLANRSASRHAPHNPGYGYYISFLLLPPRLPTAFAEFDQITFQ